MTTYFRLEAYVRVMKLTSEVAYAGVRLVFVSDGVPPTMKERNGKRVRHQHNHPTVRRCKELIALFGFPLVEVKSGEAEAMCAYLNCPPDEREALQQTQINTKRKAKAAPAPSANALSLPYVDGCVTPDVDGMALFFQAVSMRRFTSSLFVCFVFFFASFVAFLFGARVVYKTLQILATKNRPIERFRASSISQRLGLGRHKLVAMALLLGSDYAHVCRRCLRLCCDGCRRAQLPLGCWCCRRVWSESVQSVPSSCWLSGRLMKARCSRFVIGCMNPNSPTYVCFMHS